MQAQDVTQLSTPWQSRIGATGQVVQGLDDIEQSIRTICQTQVGEVPQSDLGVDWMNIIDRDADEAVPLATSGVLLALARFEPRARVNRVEATLNEGSITLTIVWEPVGGTGERTTTAEVG